ncbi:MAG: c-type cytochrome domain-containing protein, partial [Opitutales bacterium]
MGTYSLLAMACLGWSWGSVAAKVKFNRDVRPILSENCFQCHGPDAKARKAKLRLDDKASATVDRDGTRAVVPGDPEASELIARIFFNDPDEMMPPPKTKRFLTNEQKDTLRQWIAEGAEFESHWAYNKPVRPA